MDMLRNFDMEVVDASGVPIPVPALTEEETPPMIEGEGVLSIHPAVQEVAAISTIHPLDEVLGEGVQEEGVQKEGLQEGGVHQEEEQEGVVHQEGEQEDGVRQEGEQEGVVHQEEEQEGEAMEEGVQEGEVQEEGIQGSAVQWEGVPGGGVQERGILEEGVHQGNQHPAERFNEPSAAGGLDNSDIYVVYRDRSNDERGEADGTNSSDNADSDVEIIDEVDWRERMDAEIETHCPNIIQGRTSSDSEEEIIVVFERLTRFINRVRRLRRRDHITIEYERLNEEDSDVEVIEDVAGEINMEAPINTNLQTSCHETPTRPATPDCDTNVPGAEHAESGQMHDMHVSADNQDNTNIAGTSGLTPDFLVERENPAPIQAMQPGNNNAGENITNTAPGSAHGCGWYYEGLENPLKRQRSPDTETANKNPRMIDQSSDSSNDSDTYPTSFSSSSPP